MPLTFECGVCQAIYRLDDIQITATGVKITCPKCLNFFYLRRSSDVGETPIVEHLKQDGAYDVSVPFEPETKPLPPPPPPSPSKIPSQSKAAQADHVGPTERGYMVDPDTQITTADLSDYPAEQPPKGKIEQFLVPFSLILIVGAALMFLNFFRMIKIPGLESLQMKPESELTAPAVPTPSVTGTPRYGFPVVSPEEDPWATPIPSPTPTTR